MCVSVFHSRVPWAGTTSQSWPNTDLRPTQPRDSEGNLESRKTEKTRFLNLTALVISLPPFPMSLFHFSLFPSSFACVKMYLVRRSFGEFCQFVNFYLIPRLILCRRVRKSLMHEKIYHLLIQPATQNVLHWTHNFQRKRFTNCVIQEIFHPKKGITAILIIMQLWHFYMER